ncbi:MAG: hypothetical protein ACYDA1_00570, partial [Vulcanimicrobiaceae bacterium]
MFVLGIDCRLNYVAIALAESKKGQLDVVAAGAYTIDRANDDDLARVVATYKQKAPNAFTVVAAPETTTIHEQTIPAYIAAKDIPAYATAIERKHSRSNPKRLAYAPSTSSLSYVVAQVDEIKRVEERFAGMNVPINSMYDRATVWLNTYAPHGVIDDVDDTLIAFVSQNGPASGSVPRRYAENGIVQDVMELHGRHPRIDQHPLAYFGDTTQARFLALSQKLKDSPMH